MEQLSARRDALIQKAIARSLAGAIIAETFKVPTKCALATALIEAAVSTVLQRSYGVCPDGTYDLANISEAARAYLRTTTDAHHLEQAVFDPEHLQIAAAALRDLRADGDWSQFALENAARVFLAQIRATSAADQDVRHALSQCRVSLKAATLDRQECSCPAFEAPLNHTEAAWPV